jgi:ketosteroid isomerase-like protein
MLKAVSALALGALLASCAASQPLTPRQMIDRALATSPGNASPGKVVAAQLAFARLAREKGQWTAFREFATDDAVMFVPEPVNARDWLARQKDPPESVRWQPHQVWMSCDGSLAVSKGAWQRPDGSFGYFTTVWERQQDGEYKWVMDQGDVLAEPLAEPDVVESETASCTPEEPGPDIRLTPVAPDNTRMIGGRSQDGSLEWSIAYSPGTHRRHMLVTLVREGKRWGVFMQTVYPAAGAP